MCAQATTQPPELADMAAAVAPELSALAPHGEREGALPQASVAALQRSGLLRLWRPAALGGYECSPLEYAVVAEVIAAADTAAAWLMMGVANTSFDLRLADARFVEEVFAGADDPVLCETFNRPMTAVEGAGGYRVSGATPFASGCRHADWIGHTALCGDRMLLVFHPRGALEIRNDWDSLGMRGTSSNTIVASDVWVATHRAIDLRAPVRNRYFDGPLYRMPEAALTATFPPVSLGALRNALAAAADLAEAKTPFANPSTLKYQYLAQLRYGRSLATYRAARSFFHDTLRAAFEIAEQGLVFSLRDKADLFLACAHALQSCADAVREVARLAGTSSIYKGNPIERAVRDTQVVSQHAFGAEGRFATVAQAYWSAEVDFPLMQMD